jgi:phosphoglycerol transferase MdoB-like AlkP superfamily enzyme
VRPDLLLVLEESTFDPTLIKQCTAKECDNAILHPLRSASRTQQGPLLVHTTGGGTWLAEFAVMSGFDWRAFGRGGAYAPVSLAPRLHASLPLQLRALGYRTIAVYPTDGNFLSATSAYGYYGFDEFYDARDLHMPYEWGDTRDAMVFDKALELAQRPDDPRPVFVFVLTIRNHGPHGASPEKIPAAFRQVGKQTTVYLADYLARMRDSSLDFVQVAQQWLSAPRPRVIAWFGDHQPEAAWDFTEHPEMLYLERAAGNAVGQQLQYLTHYQFSANFGGHEKSIARDALDISYLGAELLAFAGLPLDAGGTASRQVALACNGVMLDCADRGLINDYLSYRIHQLGAVQ